MPRAQRPNILLIVADQHRMQTSGCYGDQQVATPTFDQMAREGVQFTEWVSSFPVCGPYRASLQTGLYPHQHGEVHNAAPVNQDLRGLADYFNDAGYETCYIGKAHWNGDDNPGFIPPGRRLGWRHWHGHNRGHYHYDWPVFDEATGEQTHAYAGQYEPEAQTDFAIRWMSEYSGNRPWLMQLNWGPPHTETQDHFYTEEVRERVLRLNRELNFGIPEERLLEARSPGSIFPQHLTAQHVPQKYLDMYDPAAMKLDPNVTNEKANVARYHLKDYYALITSLDDQLAKILKHVRQSMERDGRSTIVIYTSDHGDFVGTHGRGRGKARPYQCVFRVPLLAWSPGLVPAGRTVDAIVQTPDLLPTLAGLAGIEVDPELPGVSQAPWMMGKAPGPRHDAVVLALGGWRALYDGQYCYAVTCEGGVAKPMHLFDTRADPYDLTNLLDSPAPPAQAELMRTELGRRLEAIGDQAGACFAIGAEAVPDRA